MTSRPDGSLQQQPPIRPPVSPVPPPGSVPPGGTGSRGRWIWALLIIGAFMINGMLSEEQDDTGDMVAVVSEDSELQLQVPASWEDLEGDVNPGADIEVGDPSGETVVIVVSDTKEDFAAEVPSLEKFSEVQLDRLKSVTDVSEGVSVSEYDPPAIRHVVRETIDNHNHVLVVTYLETESRLIQIVAATLASEWEANRDLLESVSNSLQERDELSIESGEEASGEEASGEEVEVVSSGQGSGFDWRACRYGSAIPFNLPDPSLNRIVSQIIRPDGNTNDNSWTRGVDEFHSAKRYCSPWIHGGEGVWSKTYYAYRDGGTRISGVNYRCNWSSSRNTYVCNRF